MTIRRPFATLFLVLAAATLAAHAAPADPAKDLKDKDFSVRLAAVEALESAGGKDCEKLLRDALTDKDWQVCERAAIALAKRGTPASVEDLVRLSIDGPA